MAISAPKKFDYKIDLLTGNNLTVTSESTTASPFLLSLNVLSQVRDGISNVKITNMNGDFYFRNSILTAEGTRNPVVTPVPEPWSLMLVASGLAGTMARLRRRKSTGRA